MNYIFKNNYCVRYGIHNFYNQNDNVLKYLYKTFELGLNPISLINKNINLIKGHFEYKESLKKVSY